jgi:hypothetical protein
VKVKSGDIGGFVFFILLIWASYAYNHKDDGTVKNEQYKLGYQDGLEEGGDYTEGQMCIAVKYESGMKSFLQSKGWCK